MRYINKPVCRLPRILIYIYSTCSGHEAYRAENVWYEYMIALDSYESPPIPIERKRTAEKPKKQIHCHYAYVYAIVPVGPGFLITIAHECAIDFDETCRDIGKPESQLSNAAIEEQLSDAIQPHWRHNMAPPAPLHCLRCGYRHVQNRSLDVVIFLQINQRGSGPSLFRVNLILFLPTL